jgi:tetratricopeptide (TPR) repeat protein
MILLITTLFAVLTFLVIYFILERKNIKLSKLDKKKWLPIGLLTISTVGLMAFRIYSAATVPDSQCTHPSNANKQAVATTANDYFLQGDHEYDMGNCKQAISDYTKAIELNPNYAEAYNNRAYTNMRMQNYKDALPDLDKAITLRPDYMNAHMNRGDIYNYYYNIDRNKAIEDYNKVIALGGSHGTSVCGHKAMAQSNNFLPLAFLRFFINTDC